MTSKAARKRKKETLRLKKDQELEEYLLSKGWTKGQYSWSLSMREGTCYRTLHQAAKIQRQIDCPNKQMVDIWVPVRNVKKEEA